MRKKPLQNRTHRVIAASVFAAMTAVFTIFLKVPIFNGNGYVHLGDTVIYICASLLPTPYAAAAATVGGGLADLLSGYAIWIPATAVIKFLLAFMFSDKSDKVITKHNIIACMISVFISTGLYYIYEGIIYGNFTVPLYSAPWNVIQSVVSGILFIVLGTFLDRLKIKSVIEM